MNFGAADAGALVQSISMTIFSCVTLDGEPSVAITVTQTVNVTVAKMFFFIILFLFFEDGKCGNVSEQVFHGQTHFVC